MTRVRCAVVMCVVLISAAPTRAQSTCDAILQYGIFDLSNTQSDEMFFSSLFRYLEKQNVRSHADADAAAGQLGISIPGVGELNMGGSSTSSAADYSNDYLKEIQNQSSAASSSFRQLFKTANPQIIAAWADCNKGGSRVWAERIDADSFYLKARWVQVEGEARPTVVSADITNATCLKKGAPSKQFEGVALSAAGTATICTQTNATSPIGIAVLLRSPRGQNVSKTFTLRPSPVTPIATATSFVVPVTKQSETGYIGFDEADRMTTLGIPTEGPQNVSFNVVAPVAGDYLVWLQMATAEPHEMWVFTDITSQSLPIHRFAPAATGGYGRANLRWVPVLALTLSNQKSTKITFSAPKIGYVSGMIPRIAAIKLQPVNLSNP